MRFIEDGPQIIKDCDLQSRNTLGVAARSRYFVSVRSVRELQQALDAADEMKVPILILGGGSNLLFVGDFDGMVIHIALKGIDVAASNRGQGSVMVSVGAGEVWHDLVKYCLQHGLHGLENLALIPGTVGAAPVQNIGAYGVELKDFFVRLSALVIETREIITMDLVQCRFGYRDSIFKQQLKNRVIVLAVSLRLSTEPHVETSYGSLREALEDHPEPIRPRDVFEAVCQIRRSRLPDPEELCNAGSFFKNPVIPVAEFQSLLERFPQLPSFSAGQDAVKIPAAWLIEQAGWKGKRQGAAGVHTQQALVLVNHGGATGQQMLELAEAIQNSVIKMFGITLEPEVQRVGQGPS